MTTRETLEKVLDELPNRRLAEVLDYAKYLTWQEDRDAWQRFGLHQLARAYGDDEPEYTEADIKKDASA